MSRAPALLALALAALLVPGTALGVERLYRCDDLAARAEKTALNSKVYQGDNGWFFRDSDLNAFYMYSPSTMQFLTRLRDALKLRGVTLTLLPLPPKSIIEPTHSAAATADGDVLFDPDFAHQQFAQFVADLKAAGLATVDVLASVAVDQGTYTGDYFFARDIHWRPRLAEITAHAVAAQLEADDPALKGSKSFTTIKVGIKLNESNSNIIFNQLCQDPIPAETLDLYRTDQADQSANDFLGDTDAAPPVDLVGTSFTDEANGFNFAGFLRQALNADVAGFSMSGGGVDTALYKWAYEGRAARDGLKALVWELPYPERLEAVAPLMERQIIPAIAGSCIGSADAVASVSYNIAAGQSAQLALPATLGATGKDYYLAASLTDPTPASFVARFAYRDGEEDVLPLLRPDRVSATGIVFGEVSDEVNAPLAGITFTNTSAQPASGTLALCRYPEALRQPPAVPAPGKVPS